MYDESINIWNAFYLKTVTREDATGLDPKRWDSWSALIKDIYRQRTKPWTHLSCLPGHDGGYYMSRGYSGNLRPDKKNEAENPTNNYQNTQEKYTTYIR